MAETRKNPHNKKSRPLNRSEMMSKVRGRNTTPERLVRSVLHCAGLRFRLHRTDLPGSPDIVLPRYRTAIFVNGCFWHQHSGCRRAVRPVTNQEFWNRKLDRNIVRDAVAVRNLEAMGWRVLVIWECELKNREWEHRLVQEIVKPSQ